MDTEPSTLKLRARGRDVPTRRRHLKEGIRRQPCCATLFLGVAISISVAVVASAQPVNQPPGAAGGPTAQQEPPGAGSETRQEPDWQRHLKDASDALSDSSRRLDWVTAVLAAISLLVVVVSLFVAVVTGVAAYFGWSSLVRKIREDVRDEAQHWNSTFTAYNEQIEASIRQLDEEGRKVAAKTQAAIDTAKEELEARLKNAMALMFGRLCRDEDDFLKVKRRDFLDKAIDLANQAYQDLGGGSEGLDSPHQWSALNNLTFYRALEGDPTFAQSALKDADRLRLRCLVRQADFHYLTTYVRVAGEFYQHAADPLDALTRAENALQTLQNHPRVGQREKEEAEQYATWLAKRKRKLLEERKGA